jgi:K+-sensing histidine kinase KdpD
LRTSVADVLGKTKIESDVCSARQEVVEVREVVEQGIDEVLKMKLRFHEILLFAYYSYQYIANKPKIEGK